MRVRKSVYLALGALLLASSCAKAHDLTVTCDQREQPAHIELQIDLAKDQITMKNRLGTSYYKITNKVVAPDYVAGRMVQHIFTVKFNGWMLTENPFGGERGEPLVLTPLTGGGWIYDCI